MTLNEEVIKIFIESQLISCHSFCLFNDYVEKKEGDSRIVFELRNSRLELHSMRDDRIIVSIEIPKSIDSTQCVSFAKKSFLEISQVIEKNEI